MNFFSKYINCILLYLFAVFISIPFFSCTNNDAVPFSHAENLHTWNPSSQLVKIQNSNHVFGGKHPWKEDILPKDFKEVLKETFSFIEDSY